MIRKTLFFIICLAALCVGTVSYAYDMNMYVNNIFVVRDIQSVAGFDMLPVADIAGELGFGCTYNEKEVVLYNDVQSFTFTVGSPAVYDKFGNQYGLDVVPQMIAGKLRIPANFFQNVFGMSYTWDSVTNTIFMNSQSAFEWITGTDEYKGANPKYMAGLYADYFRNQGTVYSYGSENTGGNRVSYRYDELWYYMADINYDGILDMVISAEDYCSNGVVVYTYKNGSIVKAYNQGMPFSAGSECYTAAVFEGRYGMFYHRYNSTDSFSFDSINQNWSTSDELWGWHYDNDYYISNSKVSEKRWNELYSKIQPVAFYNFYVLNAKRG